MILICPLLMGNASASAARAGDLEFADSLSGNYLAGRFALSARDKDNASLYLREVLKDDPFNLEINERALGAFIAAGSVREALPYARRLIKSDTNHRLSRFALAVASFRQGQREEALNHLRRLSSKSGKPDITYHLMKAWVQAGNQQISEALETLSILGREKTYEDLADFHAGLIADRAGRYETALKRLEPLIKKDPGSARTVETYARVLLRAGRTDEAIKILDAFESKTPRNPLIEELRKQVQKKAEIANTKIEPLAASALIGASEALYSLGSILARQGGEDLALLYIQLALHLHPEHDLARLGLGEIFERFRQNQAAMEAFQGINGMSPLGRLARLEEANLLERLEKKDEAKRVLENVVSERPDDTETLMALGSHYRVRKMYEQAIEAYSKAIIKLGEPKAGDWRFFYARGIAYERSKQWPLAEADFKKALTLSPDQPMVLNYLGYSWIDQSINLEEGMTMVRRAVELRPMDGYIVDSLGWAHYRLGQYDEAVRELERAVELKAGDPVINDHLGDAYWKVGRKLEAKFQWQRALDAKPEPEDAARIEVKLKKGLDAVGPATAAPSGSHAAPTEGSKPNASAPGT